jgi:hypothetical protein
MPMTFRIERLVSGENAIVLRVCGRVQIECVTTLKELIEAENATIVLDLSEVTLLAAPQPPFLQFASSRYRTQELPCLSSWMA